MSMPTSPRSVKKQLWRMALITSPLLGIYGTLPIMMFLDAYPALRPEPILSEEFRMLIGLIFVSFSTFGQWMINLWMVRIERKLTLHKFHQQVLFRYVGSFLLIGIFMGLAMGILDTIKPDRVAETIGILRFYPILTAFTNNLVILLIIRVVLANYEKSKLELQKAQLEIDHLLSQQAQLKQQIHPHFLFNVLATLQIFISRDPERAKAYTQDVAKYLRRSLEMAERNLVSVREDLDFFRQYMHLQQIRFGEAIQYEVHLSDGLLENGRLPVYTLQMLAENAIKHNAADTEHPLVIEIREGAKGRIEVSNNRRPKFHSEPTTQIGLANLSQRFGHFTEQLPDISTVDDRFSVTLATHLDESIDH
ncbi:histidine kinase [Pontibacter sp. G13]|uniref:sensor histidine kinase n=1 Tax=Pontibacter sp. G13 TaxID=3074898 RepID=UPI00288AF6C2|nr:histidine kinase [Pontibacter sp. G13]WNJ18456.1 histidine kinase [Pontibacter sp. G13]